MGVFYKLLNKARHYDWGSPVDIPRLLGMTTNGDGVAPVGAVPAHDGTPAADKLPWAELWIGSRSGFSSTLAAGETSLEDLIAGDPRRFLGEKTARRYGSLPFLLKLLAAEKPLSVQAHPNQEQAREGFERENKAGLPPDSPERNYKDPNHKPEILAALTPFTGLCGFRPVDEIRGLLAAFLEPPKETPHIAPLNVAPPYVAPPAVLREAFAPLMRALSTGGSGATGGAGALRDFLAGLFGLSQEARRALTEYVLTLGELPAGCELELMKELARLYPGDPAIIAPVYLNVFRLEPGEAVFLGAGILHTYIHGFGVELMANSDNVLRGGLTKKHIDVPELMKILDFKPYKPPIIAPNAGCFSYPVPCEEFSLYRICGTGGVVRPGFDGPSVCIVTEGELIIASGDRETVVKRGESLFIPVVKNGGRLSLKGDFTLFAASVGRGASTGKGAYSGAYSGASV